MYAHCRTNCILSTTIISFISRESNLKHVLDLTSWDVGLYWICPVLPQFKARMGLKTLWCHYVWISHPLQLSHLFLHMISDCSSHSHSCSICHLPLRHKWWIHRVLLADIDDAQYYCAKRRNCTLWSLQQLSQMNLRHCLHWSIATSFQLDTHQKK